MSKHTPGPWKTQLVDDTTVVDGNGLVIAHIGGLYLGDACPMEANARLIAAAPDLLEALKAVEAALRKDARDKSIAKDTVEYHLDGQTMYHAINTARSAISKATLPPPPETTP